MNIKRSLLKSTGFMLVLLAVCMSGCASESAASLAESSAAAADSSEQVYEEQGDAPGVQPAPAVEIEHEQDYTFYSSILTDNGRVAGRFVPPGGYIPETIIGYYDTETGEPVRVLLEDVPVSGDHWLLDATGDAILLSVIDEEKVTILLFDTNAHTYTTLLEFPLDEFHAFDASGKIMDDHVLLNYKENGQYQNIAVDPESGASVHINTENSSLPVLIDGHYYYVYADTGAIATSLKSVPADGSREPETLLEWDKENDWLHCICRWKDSLLLFVNHNAEAGLINSTSDTEDTTECILYNPKTGEAQTLFSEKGQICSPIAGGNILTWWNPVDREESRMHTKFTVYDLENNEKISYVDGHVIPSSNQVLWLRYNLDESAVPIGEVEKDGNTTLLLEDQAVFLQHLKEEQ